MEEYPSELCVDSWSSRFITLLMNVPRQKIDRVFGLLWGQGRGDLSTERGGKTEGEKGDQPSLLSLYFPCPSPINAWYPNQGKKAILRPEIGTHCSLGKQFFNLDLEWHFLLYRICKETKFRLKVSHAYPKVYNKLRPKKLEEETFMLRKITAVTRVLMNRV